MSAPHPPLSKSFGIAAHDYDRYRPSYPAEAIDYVLDALNGLAPQRILDLGAGTGKLTASLIGRAPEVIAVEPDEAMLAVLARSIPAASTSVGSAESIPLPDASVDAIFVGQAFHWFPRPAADVELARVLKPGGVLGLVWNFPDRNVEWVPKIYDATRGESLTPIDLPWEPLASPDFSKSTERNFATHHDLDGPDGLLNLVHTWSWVITRSAEDQAALDDKLRAIIANYPELQGETVRLPQHTKVIRHIRL